ncbi:MAG TPA: glycine dehydrogenase, partial [Candidatus Eremiobacteraeota bacterium]|nr:glycine dehydrogenase [Candidatus Eremiobacteraeota bacterium]
VSGLTDLNSLELTSDVAAVVIQNPNFFGCLENLTLWAEKIHKNKSLFILAILEPFSLGLLASPGECGVDIVAGEGQSFGNPISFGGPSLGFLACKNPFMRKMAGRLVGLTADHNGKRGFVLTLQTREQHIRRERATSNICSNQALCALAATVYLSYVGKEGFRDISCQSFQKAHYAAKKLSALKGYGMAFSSHFYNEFHLCCPCKPEKINKFLIKHGILGGYPLSNQYPELKDTMLLCFTERNDVDSINRLAELLEEVR